MVMLNSRLLKESNYKKYYLLIVILGPLVNSIFILFLAFILAIIVDDIFIEKQDLNSIYVYLILFFLNTVIKSIINFFIESYIKNSSLEIEENIKQKSFESIISGNPYKIKKEKLGEIITTLTDGVEMTVPYFSEFIPQIATAIIIPLIIAVATIFADKWSALIMIVTYPLIPLFMILIGYKSQAVNEKQWKKLSILSSHFIDMLQGLSTLKIFGKSKLQEYKVITTSEKYRKATMEVLKIAFSSALVLELFSTISIAIIAISLGLRLVYGKIYFFSSFFILIITPDFYLSIRNLGLRFHASLNGKVAIEKIDSIIKKLEYEGEICKSNKLDEGIFEIEVKNLNFSYGNKKVLNSISFKIRKGEKIALVGESGSGKTTLINILSGFIKVDNDMVFINGNDINYIDKKEFLSKIALATQFPHIFNKTLENNVLLGIQNFGNNKSHKICKLNEIYKITKIDELQGKLGGGYKSLIGEGENVSISGGEIQRIAFARALVKDPPIIILDEPSSSLDSKSEELFTEVIDSYLRTTTILIATHRLNTIKNSNNILVLNEGNLVEMGTHENLIHNRSTYYELVKSLEVLES